MNQLNIPIPAGKGYRLLKIGEVIRHSDKYFYQYHWLPAISIGFKFSHVHRPYRRRTPKTPSARKGK